LSFSAALVVDIYTAVGVGVVPAAAVVVAEQMWCRFMQRHDHPFWADKPRGMDGGGRIKMGTKSLQKSYIL